jgi:glycosyltransferase involved in cell wall biosynthesis
MMRRHEVLTVLHLTHTHIPSDIRILRELNTLSQSPDLEVHGYGVQEKMSPDLREVQGSFVLGEIRTLVGRISWLPRPARYALLMLEVNTRFVTRMLRLRPNIVHCHDTLVLPAGALAKVLLGSTLIYDAHELESDKAGQSPTLSKATLLIERYCWPRIDKLITVSPSITDWYAENLGPKPTACILNSPETKTVRGLAATGPEVGLRDRLEIGPEVPLFVYVGVLGPGRGIELLLETFLGADVDAHVAFFGSGALGETLDRASDSNSNIHRCELVPPDQLVYLFQEATGGFCLIEPLSLSDRYCLPNKLFTYAFAGLPVIASRLPEMERCVEQYQLGVCADLTVESITAALQDCMNAPRNLPLERLAELSWESQAEVLTQLYSGLDVV